MRELKLRTKVVSFQYCSECLFLVKNEKCPNGHDAKNFVTKSVRVVNNDPRQVVLDNPEVLKL